MDSKTLKLSSKITKTLLILLILQVAKTVSIKANQPPQTLKTSSKPMPVLFFPGLGDAGALVKHRYFIQLVQSPKTNPHKNPVYIVDYAPSLNSMYVPFHTQAQQACMILQKHKDDWGLENGYISIGESQGGLIARYVLQECSLGAFNRKLITFGSPHQGIAHIPFLRLKSGIEFLATSLLDRAFSSYFAKFFAPWVMFRSLRRYDIYLKTNTFLPMLNNEIQINSQYKERIEQLDLFVMIDFLQDEIARPYVTSQFGFYKDKNYQDMIPLQETKVYTDDRLGLKKLDLENKLKFHSCNNTHLKMHVSEIKDYIIAYLD